MNEFESYCRPTLADDGFSIYKIYLQTYIDNDSVYRLAVYIDADIPYCEINDCEQSSSEQE